MQRSHKNGISKIDGYLEDYAYFTNALLDVFEIFPNQKYLELAISLGQHLIDHPVTIEPALSGERSGDDAHPKVRLALRTPPGMAFVFVRFIGHGDAFGRESLRQLFFDKVAHAHAVPTPSVDTDHPSASTIRGSRYA